MTLTVQEAKGDFKPNLVDGDAYSLVAAVQNHDPDAERILKGMQAALGAHVFRVRAHTTTNDAAEVLDLTTKLVNFPANTQRKIVLRHWAQTDNDEYYQEVEYIVKGGPTPVLIGHGPMSAVNAGAVQGKIVDAFGVLNGAAQSYGLVHYHGVLDVEATDGTNSHGVAAAAFSSGVSALTVPLRRTAFPVGSNVEQETFSAAEAAYGVIQDYDAAGSPTFQSVQADDGTGATNPTAGTNVAATLLLFPPVNAFLVMNGNNVEVWVSGISSDEIDHVVDVYIGPLQVRPFSLT